MTTRTTADAGDRLPAPPNTAEAASLYQRLRGRLAVLKLRDAAEALPAVLDQSAAQDLSMTAALDRLLSIEVEATEARRLAGRLRFACLPTPASLEDFDYDAAAGGRPPSTPLGRAQPPRRQFLPPTRPQRSSRETPPNDHRNTPTTTVTVARKWGISRSATGGNSMSAVTSAISTQPATNNGRHVPIIMRHLCPETTHISCAFAHLCGVAPIPAAGKTNRNRLHVGATEPPAAP